MSLRLLYIAALLSSPLIWAQASGRPPIPGPLRGPAPPPPAAPKVPAPSAAPEFPDESLPYLINWPSGLSLGEVVLTSKNISTPNGEKRLKMEARLNVAVPAFPVIDVFRSEATADYCSIEFEKVLSHGKKKSEEKISFDQASKTATRKTTGGGKSEIAIPACAKDALTFLYYTRRELKQGRIPPPQNAYYGSPYQVRLEYSGTQTIRSGDATVEADKVVGTVKGPASNAKFEAFFARDAVRTPLVIRIPLPIGMLSMELSR